VRARGRRRRRALGERADDDGVGGRVGRVCRISRAFTEFGIHGLEHQRLRLERGEFDGFEDAGMGERRERRHDGGEPERVRRGGRFNADGWRRDKALSLIVHARSTGLVRSITGLARVSIDRLAATEKDE